MKCAWLPLALLLTAFDVAAAEPLGRLFYTPGQRAQLDVLRSQKSVAPVAPEQEEPVPVPEVITYGGIVRRSDGKTTVWINNRVVNDGKATDRLPISSRVRADDSVSLQLPQAARSIDLRVGQSVEIVSGAVAEPYARSAVSARSRSSTEKPASSEAAAKSDTAPARARRPAKDEEDDEQSPR